MKLLNMENLGTALEQLQEYLNDCVEKLNCLAATVSGLLLSLCYKALKNGGHNL